jgi:hypothetical protein
LLQNGHRLVPVGRRIDHRSDFRGGFNRSTKTFDYVQSVADAAALVVRGVEQIVIHASLSTAPDRDGHISCGARLRGERLSAARACTVIQSTRPPRATEVPSTATPIPHAFHTGRPRPSAKAPAIPS